jgi:hypothetical protein
VHCWACDNEAGGELGDWVDTDLGESSGVQSTGDGAGGGLPGEGPTEGVREVVGSICTEPRMGDIPSCWAEPNLGAGV